MPGHRLRAQVLSWDRNLVNRSDVHWPSKLIIVRHGQSAGNIARDTAHETASDRIALSVRDADVPLSDLGREQATSLGRWFATHVERSEERREGKEGGSTGRSRGAPDP